MILRIACSLLIHSERASHHLPGWDSLDGAAEDLRTGTAADLIPRASAATTIPVRARRSAEVIPFQKKRKRREGDASE